MKLQALLVLALGAAATGSLAACGDDSDNGGGGGGGGGQAAAPPPVAPGPPKAQLTPQVHVEDRVSDAEKDTIRHKFVESDFTADTNRDPFSSTVLIQYNPTAVDPNKPPPKPVECKSALIAQNYSYADLKLVGIVAQGSQRKVLMMDPGNLGRIIKPGDCVGKEKALVKEIGTTYLTFVVTAEAPGPGKPARTDEHSVPLHADDLDVTADLSQPTIENGAPEATPAPVLPSNGGRDNSPNAPRLPSAAGPPPTAQPQKKTVPPTTTPAPQQTQPTLQPGSNGPSTTISPSKI